MSRIRVAYFNHTEAVGGAETSLGLLLRYIDKRKIEAKLFCPEGPLSNWARQMLLDVRDVRIRPVGFSRSPARLIAHGACVAASARLLARELEEFRPDVVHANTIRAGLIASIAKAMTRRKFVLVVHLRDCLPSGMQSGLIKAVIHHQADQVVAISQHVLLKSGFGNSGDRSPVVISNGVDLDAYRPALLSGDAVRNDLGIDGCSPVFSIVGQITPWKGQLEAIQAFAAIAGEFPAARLLVVGEAKFTGAESRYDTVAYERQLRAEVASLGLEGRVIFTGERSDIPQVMAASDVLVLASWEEPFGRVLIEAMAAGKPTVATRAGGVPEIVVDGETGILVPPKTPASLAEAMARLGGDEELRRRMGAQGASRAEEHFGVGLHVERITALYMQMVTEHESRNRQ